jgi:uncharacterized protein YegL
MHAKRRMWLNCLAVIGALLVGHAGTQSIYSSRRPLAASIVVPQARSFAPDRQSAVEVTDVTVGVVILEQAATTTMDIGLRNPTARRIEAELAVPVPDGAVVLSFTFQGAAKEPTAELLMKNEATRTYEAIVARVRDPAMLEFIGYNLIRSSVFPLEPKGTQKVRLTYEHILPADGDRIDYVLPRTESLDYNVPWKISVRIKSRRPISTAYSPSHKIETTRLDIRSLHDADIPVANIVSVRLADDAATEPGSFRLSYLLEREGVTASLFSYPDASAHGGYFLLLAGLSATPTGGNGGPAIKREVTLVLDRSGSMSGEKIEQVRQAALQVLAGLEEGEAFNVITYNDAVERFSREPLTKTAKSVAAAHAYLRSVKAGGGTNIHDALLEALRQKPAQEMLAIVLFLTDGLPTVGQTSEIAIRNVAIKANPYERRIFTFGVGVDVNTPLLEKIALETRGTATFVLPKEDVEVKVSQVFNRLAGPVLASPKLEIVSAKKGWALTGSESADRLACLSAKNGFLAATIPALLAATTTEPRPTTSAAREATVRETFRSIVEGKTHVDFPSSGERPRFTWSDIPILLKLAENDTALATMPALAISSYIGSGVPEGMVALWLIEGLRRGQEELLAGKQLHKPVSPVRAIWPPLNPICLREGMKLNECENSAEIHREVLNAYRQWWGAVKSLSPMEAALFDPLDLKDLKWSGAAAEQLEIYDARRSDGIAAQKIKKAWQGPVLKTTYYTLDERKLAEARKSAIALEMPFDKSMLAVQKVVLHFYDEKGNEIRTEEYLPPVSNPDPARKEVTPAQQGELEVSLLRVRDVIPSRLPDLFEGDQLVVIGKYIGEDPLTFELSGNYLGKKRTFRFTFDLDKATTRNAFVPRLWASRKIAVLVDAVRQLGADVGPFSSQRSVSHDPRLKELVDEIVSLSTEFGILTEYTAFLAREGTDLTRRDAVLAEAGRNFLDRAVSTRSGLASVNQSFNADFQLRQQVLNYRNNFFDQNMSRVAIARVQQVSDLAFYRRGGRWVDSRVVQNDEQLQPQKIITFGSEEFRKLAQQLAAENRQGAISLEGEVLLVVDGQPVLVKGPAK